MQFLRLQLTISTIGQPVDAPHQATSRHAHAAPARRHLRVQRPGRPCTTAPWMRADPQIPTRSGHLTAHSVLTPPHCSHRLTAHTAHHSQRSDRRWHLVAYGRSSRLTRITIERSVRPTHVVTHCRKQELMWASIKDSAVEGVPSGLVAVFLSRSSSLESCLFQLGGYTCTPLSIIRTSNNAT